jgi:mRNA-degrading endonuclease RelE of RelBE toxin-antitoxin system
MKWELIVDGDAKKRLRRFPRRDQERIAAALIDMEADPLSGNTVKLKGTVGFRRRVGAYRILFELNFDLHRVSVTDIERRTSSTY